VAEDADMTAAIPLLVLLVALLFGVPIAVALAGSAYSASG